MNASNVSVGYNNQVHANEAAKQLNCSYSHLVNLIKSKKIKAQKYEGRWMVDNSDLQRAKATKLVKPHGKHKKTPITGPIFTDDSNEVSVQLKLPRHKIEMIRLVFEKAGSGKNLQKYLTAQIDKLYEEISDKLSTISI